MSAPRHSSRLAAIAISATALLVLSGCADKNKEENPTESTTVVTSTVEETASSSSSSSSSTKSSSSTTAPSPATQAPASTKSPEMGYTGAPTGDPTPINKTISRCAKYSEGIYQQGTTWFTDGTSGWTQTCAGQYWDKAWKPEPAPTPDWDDDDDVVYEEWECVIDEYGEKDCWQVY